MDINDIILAHFCAPTKSAKPYPALFCQCCTPLDEVQEMPVSKGEWSTKLCNIKTKEEFVGFQPSEETQKITSSTAYFYQQVDQKAIRVPMKIRIGQGLSEERSIWLAWYDLQNFLTTGWWGIKTLHTPDQNTYIELV